MGELVKFRRKRFSGFFPEGFGEGDESKKNKRALPPCLSAGRDAGSIAGQPNATTLQEARAELIEFARQGEPKIPAD